MVNFMDEGGLRQECDAVCRVSLDSDPDDKFELTKVGKLPAGSDIIFEHLGGFVSRGGIRKIVNLHSGDNSPMGVGAYVEAWFRA